MKIFESITLEGILLMALGLILGSSSNLLFIVIGGTIFIVGVVFPILKSELSPIGRSYWKLVEAEDVARELKTRMFYVPSGIPGHDFAGGRAGGDNIAFFVESNSKEYFNYLASFVSQGIKNIEKEEIVIFVARDEDSKRYFFSQKEIDASSDRLYVITLEDLPQPEEGKDFFTVIKPVVDALVQTIEERRGDKKVDLIRLITDDLSILQGREDFRLLMIEFNANLEKQISRYPYFRNPAFFSVGTYVLSSQNA
ncbi:MAG: hypothetical protein M1347_00810, partial [Chloroflexi bacterium]|nr:hypothetical protein [Chloroflexota bacterium]